MRYLPLTDDDRAAMLSTIGVSNIDDLFEDVPQSARRDGLVDLPLHKGEAQVDREMRKLARSNMAGAHHPFFVGAGAYRHYVPATVDHLIQRSEFLTAYTPYQPEISQGTLQYLFEFQTQVALITGMEVANASMYDGSTACAEAALMAMRLTRKDKVVMAAGLHPQYADVVETTLKFGTGSATTAPFGPGQNPDDLLAHVDDDTACVIVQNPDVFGEVRDLMAFAEKLHESSKALLIVVFTEAVSLGALKSPGAMGADIVVGEGQSIGNALNFGGPYVGLMATRQKFVRQMPGRLAGETVDADGKRGFVLTLSTREQHIRREKATSNICTNSGLCALAFTIHMSLLGDAGFRHLAQLNHARAVQVADRLAALPGVELVNDSFFNEFTLRLPKSAGGVVEQIAKDHRVLAGVPGARLWPGEGEADNLLILAVTECAEDDDINALETALKGALS